MSIIIKILINQKNYISKKNEKNIIKINTLVFLIIKMHIWSTRFLEDNVFITKYKLKKRVYRESIGLDQGNYQEIEKTIVIDKTNKNNVKNF